MGKEGCWCIKRAYGESKKTKFTNFPKTYMKVALKESNWCQKINEGGKNN
jgi:hypothetical protein